MLNERGAREQADASAARWRSGKPLSAIDGMPIGIKDLIETKDMPTQMGCAAFEGNFPKRDSALVRALRDAGAVILGQDRDDRAGRRASGADHESLRRAAHARRLVERIGRGDRRRR